MLARRKPYAAENPMAIIYKHRKDPIPRLPDRFSAMQPLIDGFLAKEPADRFADAEEATRALEAVYRKLVAAETVT
jgi:serine/threonine-protein kinase PpkA